MEIIRKNSITLYINDSILKIERRSDRSVNNKLHYCAQNASFVNKYVTAHVGEDLRLYAC